MSDEAGAPRLKLRRAAADVRCMRSRALSTSICLLLFVLSSAVPARTASEVSGPFQLQGGRNARRELAFAVHQPGSFRIRVESRGRIALALAVIAPGGLVISSTRIVGSGEVTIMAAPELVAKGIEWAATVQAYEPGEDASGRIRVMDLADAPRRAGHDVDRFLLAHPAVAYHLMWRDAQGVRSYSAWPDPMRARLRALVDDARRGISEPQRDPAPLPPFNAWQPTGENDVTTALTPEDAREMYLETVATSLMVEMDRRVPWSVSDLNEDGLDALFSSNALFFWRGNRGVYEIAPHAHGWAVPAPAAVALRFLHDHEILHRTRRDTLVALIEWTRQLTHFAGATSPDNFADFWGYRGGMPVARALTGTRYGGVEFREYPQYDQVRHYTAGCHGTVGLLVNVLRSVNIPARYRSVQNASSSHATAMFLSEDLTLTHGDDPYSQMSVGAPAAELMVDRATYDAWLGPLAADPGPSIGRQALVLGLRYLPPYLRQLHALDQQDHRSREASRVFDVFRGVYSMRDLEQARLWPRLGAAR